MFRQVWNLQSRTAWTVTFVLAALVFVVAPVLNLAVPEGAALHLPNYMVQLLGKFLCFAILALALDLVWGYTGILSLGHALFFALGGYAMGMYLMRAMAGEGVYRSKLPDFMVFLDWKELPWFWLGFDHFWFALLVILVVPALLALIFGFFAFRSRIKGVYFSIITQALTYAAMLLFFRNNTGFGGNNGLTDFKRLLGFSLAEPATKTGLFLCSGLVLLLFYLLCRAVTASKLGRVLTAVRDAESRVMFLGYDPLRYKLFVWTLSAFMCSVAGALYVPQVGIINPSEMAPANSIEIAIWVALGGRGTLAGPLLGAFAVNGAKSVFTALAPDLWLFVLSAIFILATLFLPRGLLGLLTVGRKKSVDGGGGDAASRAEARA
ncbi:urea ABC transporter permease subunit UrtC [Solidesulfovibrio sp. C21]|uniref:urea ABC transporter permease subunit UrtC n=1 Tax=Solidesulfovibrio sp. C21 TaxID=3398613 RepID=UPI0039FBF6D3